ncbi:MAG: PUR family DNA/RNA-binding protein [Candidatus Cardinium sp.]|uniref:DUF3276 family protein n=1 Tax=Candidatus Cardinium hertigii TaxID=247481 RepID=A0A2Z3LHY8_9BACT|nr:DUF3276 family protein [Candidatus Cardinium hertigii]AWN81660.1 hypothetical protein DK880_00331 [Candidatus Cardinium hertigii]MDD9139678.1 PUR family DNA/RNA-binding protein [Candidatus Cardinium sp.]
MESRTELDEIYSKRVNAGKRVYFFDIKSTRSKDYYLTITESKKRTEEDGMFYEKHKIFLYKEDVNKFVRALNEVVHHLKTNLMSDYAFDKNDRDTESYQK